MSTSAAADERRDRRGTNALFSGNKLKLGLFGPNCDHGCAMTLSSDVPSLTWEYTKQVAEIADRAGFEALVPVARWKAIGDNGFNGRNFETYTWAAGLASVTDHITLVATAHVQASHPAAAAKMVATVDHISGGRVCLNIVNGWFEPEFKMLGSEFLPHDRRYQYTTEWFELVRKFWTEDSEFDFIGEFFRVEGGYSQPKPVQSPLPSIMNAGGSKTGREFIAKYADAGYVLLAGYDLDAARAQVEARANDAAEVGREVDTWTTAYVIQRDTKEEAQAYLQKVFVDEADMSAGDAAAKYLGLNSSAMEPHQWEEFNLHLRAGYGGYPLVGTADDIAEELARLSDIGVAGVSLSFVDFVDGLERFNADVLPKLENGGLRKPYSPHA
ncbi:LLM class flavin-dependent oxidoreductase [Amycolatopsis sp. RM579]|uniref:LLM class flavin-dependent oxidoreductase n=2 Tax=Amycolatopsis pithecellobii TaxID=664692 RepID=A0A6N7Z1V3_9PSEU|nr:LLM class flavin-dependent oxidoreductase [Amycolatopsis pithecellobii]